MAIPQNKLDKLKHISEARGVSLTDLIAFYERNIADPEMISMVPDETERYNFIDGQLNVYVNDLTSSVLEEFDFMAVIAGKPLETKTGGIFSNYVLLAVHREGVDKRVKIMAVKNSDDSGIIYEPLAALDTGIIKVSVGKETDGTIEAYSKPGSTISKQMVTSFPQADKKAKHEYLRKVIRTVKIDSASKNLTPKDEKGYSIPFGLRMVRGTVSSCRINKKINETTKVESENCILNIIDESVELNSEFFKNKETVDPENPTKKKTIYGGFGGFADADDARPIGKGSLVDLIGFINSANSITIGTILPVITKAPITPKGRLNIKPGNTTAPAAHSAGNIVSAPLPEMLDPSKI
jgi:hypothetical protein